MINITIKDTGNGLGTMSLVQSEDSQKYYVVSSVSNGMANETYIFPANEKGDVTDYSEVYGVRPSQHQSVLDELTSGTLTEKDFY